MLPDPLTGIVNDATSTLVQQRYLENADFERFQLSVSYSLFAHSHCSTIGKTFALDVHFVGVPPILLPSLASHVSLLFPPPYSSYLLPLPVLLIPSLPLQYLSWSTPIILVTCTGVLIGLLFLVVGCCLCGCSCLCKLRKETTYRPKLVIRQNFRSCICWNSITVISGVFVL